MLWSRAPDNSGADATTTWAKSEPGARNASIDRLRALGFSAVVPRRWPVTAVVVGGYGLVAVDSPLRTMPSLTPLTWVLQALAALFCAAGFVSARSLDGERRRWPWVGHRMRQMTSRLGEPVVSPLWFLVVLATRWLGWPALSRLDRRLRWLAPLLPASVVVSCTT